MLTDIEKLELDILEGYKKSTTRYMTQKEFDRLNFLRRKKTKENVTQVIEVETIMITVELDHKKMKIEIKPGSPMSERELSEVVSKEVFRLITKFAKP